MIKNLLAIMSLLFFYGCLNKDRTNLGLIEINKDGKQIFQLHDCSNEKGCLSSYADAKNDKYIDPIKYSEPTNVALLKLRKVLSSYPNCKIALSASNYIRAEITSSFLGIVDNFEFYFAEKGIIHLRSASGNSWLDFGENRKSINQIIFNFFQS